MFKKISFVILSIFIFCLFFGITNTKAVYLGDISPVVISPETEEEDVSLTPTFKWKSPWVADGVGEYDPDENEVVEYEWKIGRSAGGSDMGSGIVAFPNTSFTLSIADRLDEGTTYYWSVRANVYLITHVSPEARELDSQTGWMKYGVFSTPGLTNPIIGYPAFDDYEIPNNFFSKAFEWQLIDEADLYFWELSWDSKEKANSTVQTKIYPGKDFESLEYDTSYTLKVKACIDCKEVSGKIGCELCSGWSIRSFVTKPPEELLKAELISPDGATVSPTPTLKWKEVIGARFYKWEIKEVKSNAFVDSGWVIAPLTEKTISKVLPNIAKGYYWTINTCPEKIDNNKCSGFGEEMTFLVDETLTVPVSKSCADSGGRWCDPDQNQSCNDDQKVNNPKDQDNHEDQTCCKVACTILTPGSKPGDVITACDYYAGGCHSIGKFCFNPAGVSVCRNCSDGWKNCDDKEGCECELAAGKNCVGGNCVVTGKACISGVDCSKNQWCNNDICKPCPSGSANCDLSGYCECDLSNNKCDGKTCVPLGSGSDDSDYDGTGIQNPLKFGTFGELASAINQFIFVLALAVAPILFAYGGFMIVTAGGDPLQVQKAKKLMTYAAIGLIVILLAQAIVYMIRSVIGVKEETTYIPLIFSGLITSFRNLKFKRSK